MRHGTTPARRLDGRSAAAGALLVAVLVLALLLAGAPRAAAASGTPYFGIGTQSIATPGTGGRVMYVATNGTDFVKRTTATGSYEAPRSSCLAARSTDPVACPPATASHPLRTVQAGIRSARAGDVVVVRGGTYKEAVGWGAVSGVATKRIVLQSYPGERVDLRGTLMLKRVSYWTVRGFHFLYEPTVQTGQAVVNLEGGTGWVFSNNEVASSPGVANVLVTPGLRSGTAAERTAAGPRDYTISLNCIRNNRGAHTHGMDHNIYLMAGTYSGGGLIERNLLTTAPNGSNIKVGAAGWSTSGDSPKDVTIRRNTMLGGASGVIVGLNSANIRVQSNLIANPSGEQKWDGGVKLWEVKRQDLVSVTQNLIAGYAKPFVDATSALKRTGNSAIGSTVATTGSACSTLVSSPKFSSTYGQRSGL